MFPTKLKEERIKRGWTQKKVADVVGLTTTAVSDIENGKANMPKNCEYCNNFMQHYIRSGNSYAPTHYGCCVAGNRIKTRKTDETCKSFVKKSYGKNYL